MFNEKEFKKVLETKDKAVLIDFVCQYKWERDYFQRAKEQADQECKKLEKALDIAVFNLICTIKGLKDKAEKKAKKEELKQMCLEVAEFLVDENSELKEIK